MQIPQIGLCITGLEPGGAERAFVELAVGLDRSRFKPTVFVLSKPPVNPILTEKLSIAGIPCVYFGLDSSSMVNRMRSLCRLPGIVKQFRQNITVRNIVLIQSFLFHANVLGRKAAQGLVTSQGQRVRTISGYRVCEPRRWQNYIDRRTAHLDTAAVAVSESVADYYRQKNHVWSRMLSINNGVDTNIYTPDNRRFRSEVLMQLGIPSGPETVIVLAAGRLTAQKGFQTLINSAPSWLEPATNVHLVIAGQGPLEKRLQNQILSMGLKRVHLIGYCSEMPKLMGAADLFVVTSRWEGLPNVALEACATGLPLVTVPEAGLSCITEPYITTYTTGILDSSEKGLHNQQLGSNWTIDELGAAITGFIINAEARKIVGLGNMEKVVELFSWEKMVKSYENLWNWALEG